MTIPDLDFSPSDMDDGKLSETHAHLMMLLHLVNQEQLARFAKYFSGFEDTSPLDFKIQELRETRANLATALIQNMGLGWTYHTLDGKELDDALVVATQYPGGENHDG